MEKHVEKENKDSKNVQSLSGDFRVITCALFKACRLFNPQRCNMVLLTQTDIPVRVQ